MRIARIIGSVTLNRHHPAMTAARLRLAVPLSLDDLAEGRQGEAEPLVVWDDFGAGDGDLIAVSEGGEAAQPFRPELKPVDAYCAAILDNVHLGINHADK